MRVALCQFNPTIGAISQNAERIEKFAQKAHERDADLIIFPELAICGYPPKDLLFHEELHAQIDRELQRLARVSPIPILLGAPIKHQKRVGQPFWNAAVFCFADETRVVARKTLLPNYDVFDERRYFEPGSPVDGNNLLQVGDFIFGITICEDAWNDDQFWEQRRYETDPVAEVAERGAHVIVNIAASPFSSSKPKRREQMLAHLAKRHHLPLFMVGQVGANDQLIFDGGSTLIDENGNVLCRLNGFNEGLLFADLDGSKKINAHEPKAYEPIPEKIELMTAALSLGIHDYVEKCGAAGILVGLSGGVDSALVAALSVKALGAEKVIGVRMPSQFSSSHSLEDAAELARNLGIRTIDVPIEPVVAAYRDVLFDPLRQASLADADIADQNLQARVRGMILMALSNLHHFLVLATGNKSELAVGYATLYGDMCGALAPLGDVYKTDIWEMARYLNKNRQCIPQRTITKAPSAELKQNQTDQDTLPPYAQLDSVLFRYIDQSMPVQEIIRETKMSAAEVGKIVQWVHANDYKRRQSALILMVSECVFGEGRRWPVAKNFNPF